MPTRHPLTISLTPELANMVAGKVASGLYGSASEVIRAGLRLLAVDSGQGSPSQPDPRLVPRHVGLRAARKKSSHD